MAKYSFEFKKKVVLAYLNGEGGYSSLAKKYKIPDDSQVLRWVNNYKNFGDAGLMRSRKHKVYTLEKKLSVVELYLTSEISYQELAIQEGITNPSMIVNWVQRFRAAGPEALRPRKKGRKTKVKKRKINTKIQHTDGKNVTISAELYDQLTNENLWLRIENACLKELRRLRLKDEKKMRERHLSSTVSEENSN